MPRRKDDLLKKQNRLIATRLMQISLLVDDYLYQQKPMSVNSAFAYIKEISGYKDKCLQDVRSLQVIEKLTRCMKGIVDEQQEINGECFEDLFVHSQHTSKANGLPSPVYSTIDEDLTQCLDIDEDITEIDENGRNINNNVEIIYFRSDAAKETDHFGGTNVTETYKTKKVTESSNITAEKYPQNDLEVIDLCDYENNINEPDFNIQVAISNLSMRDIEEALTPFSQECSQSILNSYTELQNDKDPLTIDYEDVITSSIHQKPAKKNDKITKIVLPKKIHAKDRKITDTGILAIQNNNITEEPGIIERTKASKPVSKKRNSITKGSNSKVVNRTKKNKPRETSRQAQSKITKRAKQFKHIEESHAQKSNQYQYEKNKTPLTNSKQLEEPTGTNMTQSISKGYNSNPIYNSMIVNDLSWIENIRYVREISREEYENFTENETFWENHTLPSHWNENDFNY